MARACRRPRRERGAAAGALELAAALLGGAGEGAGLVAEHLALDELARDGGAVHLLERALGALAREVDGAGDELFPVPRSPVTKTVAEALAARPSCSRSSAIERLWPMSSPT